MNDFTWGFLVGLPCGGFGLWVLFAKEWLKRIEAASDKIAQNRVMLETTWKEIKEELEWRSV